MAMPDLQARPIRKGPRPLAGTRNIQSAPAPERSDAELLQAIAADRNEEAFAELFRRYERAAYGLALQITGSHASAEEAAQEAFLRIWLRAENFRASEGQPRSWLLQIFARESLKMIRRRRKAVRAAEKEATRQAVDAAGVRDTKEVPGEREELLAALRRGVSGLPESTRQMVALYFGAGLSQEEIGKELEISQTTVSMRITSAMNDLRANLGKAGFAAAVPMLESGALQDAILESGQAPSTLLSNIQGKLANAARVTGRVSRRVATTSVAGKTIAAVAVLAMAAAGTALWMANPAAAPSKPGPPAGEAERDAKEAEANATAAPAPEPGLLARWDFEKGPADDLPLFQGTWVWKQLPNGGAMTAPTDDIVCVLFPRKLPERPFFISLKVSAEDVDPPFGFDVHWVDQTGNLPCRKAMGAFPKSEARGTVEAFVFEDVIIHKINGKPLAVSRFDKAYPSQRVSLMIKKYNVYEIEIREWTPVSRKEVQAALKSDLEQIGRLPKARTFTMPSAPLNWAAIPKQYR